MKRAVLVVALALLGIAAAPAQATLLVKSTTTDGLFVQDKNGLNDIVTISGFGATAYRIDNTNSTDFFDFDFQAGCSDGGNRRATCNRFGPKMEIQLLGGDDSLGLGLAPIGESSITTSGGNDSVGGHQGKDNISGGSGNDRLDGGPRERHRPRQRRQRRPEG
jgi:hypothetical protein